MVWASAGLSVGIVNNWKDNFCGPVYDVINGRNRSVPLPFGKAVTGFPTHLHRKVDLKDKLQRANNASIALHAEE